MVKLVFCLRRLPHLSLEEFQRYWLDTHAPLVCERAPLLGIRRYVQVHTLDTPRNDALQARNGSEEPYDGVAENLGVARAQLLQLAAALAPTPAASCWPHPTCFRCGTAGPHSSSWPSRTQAPSRPQHGIPHVR